MDSLRLHCLSLPESYTRYRALAALIPEPKKLKTISAAAVFTTSDRRRIELPGARIKQQNVRTTISKDSAATTHRACNPRAAFSIEWQTLHDWPYDDEQGIVIVVLHDERWEERQAVALGCCHASCRPRCAEGLTQPALPYISDRNILGHGGIFPLREWPGISQKNTWNSRTSITAMFPPREHARYTSATITGPEFDNGTVFDNAIDSVISQQFNA
ncbi:hypothetical protein BKA62DRAFT_759139 [Auriculariales sp. MPI-PUGE-AT-0066]|nr:hypothetical protein BKA62DRAFT_759139 [Auriculariales sp. MPI-PUGE-AT-0066]